MSNLSIAIVAVLESYVTVEVLEERAALVLGHAFDQLTAVQVKAHVVTVLAGTGRPKIVTEHIVDRRRIAVASEVRPVAHHLFGEVHLVGGVVGADQRMPEYELNLLRMRGASCPGHVLASTRFRHEAIVVDLRVHLSRERLHHQHVRTQEGGLGEDAVDMVGNRLRVVLSLPVESEQTAVQQVQTEAGLQWLESLELAHHQIVGQVRG